MPSHWWHCLMTRYVLCASGTNPTDDVCVCFALLAASLAEFTFQVCCRTPMKTNLFSIGAKFPAAGGVVTSRRLQTLRISARSLRRPILPCLIAFSDKSLLFYSLLSYRRRIIRSLRYLLFARLLFSVAKRRPPTPFAILCFAVQLYARSSLLTPVFLFRRFLKASSFRIVFRIWRRPCKLAAFALSPRVSHRQLSQPHPAFLKCALSSWLYTILLIIVSLHTFIAIVSMVHLDQLIRAHYNKL